MEGGRLAYIIVNITSLNIGMQRHAEHARVIFSAGWVEMRHFVCLLLPFL